MKIVNRIRSNEDFAKAIKNSKVYKNPSFVVHIHDSEFDYTRIGISVSSKLGNAVIRNRIKRQIREMCQNLLNFNANHNDIVIIAKHDFLNQDFAFNQKKLDDLLFTQAGLNK